MLFASSSHTMHIGQASEQRSQAYGAAKEAKRVSERALLQATRLQEVEEKTTQQVLQVLSTHAESLKRRYKMILK